MNTLLCLLVVLAPAPLKAMKPIIDEDVIEFQQSKFEFPIIVTSGAREQIRRVQLYVSTDEGKTWALYAEKTGEEKWIQYEAPKDGLYWFALRTLSKDGRAVPASPKELRPAQKVLVNTAKTTVVVRKAARKQAASSPEPKRAEGAEKPTPPPLPPLPPLP